MLICAETSICDSIKGIKYTLPFHGTVYIEKFCKLLHTT